MSKQIICDGDKLLFLPTFGHRQVIVTSPAVIRGSGHATVKGKKICVLGDEKKVRIKQVPYNVPGHSPGTGTLTIAAVAGNQQTPRIKGKQALLVKGQFFDARFTPTQPAMTLGPSPTPEPATPTMGKGKFLPRQVFATARG